ncbi:NAD(P)-binding protein [Xylariaceae sp. FL0662B]|nr:NAD(P)-binding protein [Xylariaceae sp. FL0662B]
MASSENSSIMRAWLYTSTKGGLEKNIHLKPDAPRPTYLSKDEILVRVRSTSVNPADYKLPELGVISRLFLISTPAVPCMDFAGTVEKTGGDDDASFKVGEPVFGNLATTRFGSLGEYVVAKRSACARVPEGVTFEQASTVGTAGQTALHAIAPHVREGDKVFINGGTGGTGTFSVQIAKALGCHVTASCSDKNADLCRSLGADEVIEYTKDDVSGVLKAKGPIYKLVVDNVGSSPPDLYKAADHFLLPEGRFVQVGVGNSFKDIKVLLLRMFLPSFLGNGHRKYETLMLSSKHDDLEKIGNWMKEGKVKPVIDETFEYEDAPKAFERLKAGHAKGKIVIRGAK